MDTNFYELRLSRIQPLGESAAAFYFDLPAELKETFSYQAGQYLTLKVELNGQEERRAYSLCSAPHEPHLAIGVKRVKGGKVSNYLLDQVKEGDTLQVMPPQGRFTVKPELERKADYFLFAGGSGITPLLSIAKTILEEEPKSQVHLYYANRQEGEIMFQAELAQWEKRYAGQFFLQHILSQPKTEKKGGLFGLFAKNVSSWAGETGRMDKAKIARFCQNRRAEDGRQAAYFLCGPDGLRQTVKDCLIGMGIAASDIREESFGEAGDKTGAASDTAQGGGAKIIATISGKKVEVILQDKETILQGLRRAGHNPPFSCLSGACSTCMAQVSQGAVHMERCLALDEREIKQGYILTCSAIPTTPLVELNYDV